MGIKLSSVAPLQIISHEFYISDVNGKWPGLMHKKSLNTARFLKSVLCQLGNRDCVVKLFVLPEFSLDLKPYQDEIERITAILESAYNCIPYFVFESTERAIYLVRQYEKTNLYDRMSVRPFLSIIEKKWITFQILTALKQCHGLNTCHGDIKMENFLVTPWLWINLTDFASFKPVLLPEDSPADYSYFFDTSWRRLGYVAPERFNRPVHLKGPDYINEAVLTPAMDIFSAGCVIAELFAETPLFNLPSLFRYMADEYFPEEILNQIQDPGIKEMVVNMISKDPLLRKEADYFLQCGKGKMFPDSFYDFLWPLMAQNRENEDCVTNILTGMIQFINNMETSIEEKPREDDEISIIFATIIASNLDDIKDGEDRMFTIEILRSLANLVPENVLSDTILPAVIYLIKHVEESSTTLGLYVLMDCISKFRTVPPACTNLYPDCIFPCLGEVVRDERFFMRRGVAETIGFYAKTSQRFFAYCLMKKYVCDYVQSSKSLEESVNKIVSAIFCDSVPSVRKAIVNHSIEPLCLFFGEHKASDALLSHLITYLNEKKDFLLRLSFYRCIVIVALNVGYRPAELIKPLLLQGISDVEESVAAVSIRAMEELVKMNKFHRRHLCSILEQVVVLLIHPNIWIRTSVLRLISEICQNQPLISVLAIFKPIILPFLTNDISKLCDKAVLWGSLKPIISRKIYEEFLKTSHVSILLTELGYALQKSHVKQTRTLSNEEERIVNEQKNAIRRLLAYGVTEDMLKMLCLMKDHFLKVNQNQNNVDASLNIIAGKQIEVKRKFPSTVIYLSSDFLQSMYFKIPEMDESTNENKSSEWEVMSGCSHSKDKYPYSSIDRSKNPLETSLISENEKSSDCYPDDLVLSTASHKQLDAYICSKVTKFPFEHQSYHRKVIRSTKKVDKDWRPDGKIIAHLHEHSQGISRLAQIPGKTYYVSASRDGTSKIWDSAKAERKYPVNKSKGTYVAEDGGNLISLACDSSGENIAVGSHKGSIEIFKLDRPEKIAGNQLKEIDYMATDMNFMDLGSNKVLTFGTPYSHICGWDIRSKDISFRLENNNKIGPITSYVISPCQRYLFQGTSFGFIVCWDLRYRMIVSQIRHPEGWDIRKVKLHPTNPSMVVAAMTNNNEIDFYGLEFKTKSKVLWASPASPVKTNASVRHTATEDEQIKSNVNALHVDQTKSGEIFVLSGGDDCKLRYWNIDQPEESRYISNSYMGGRLMYNIPFSSKEINGTEYIIESFAHKKPLMSSEQINNVPIQPYPGHKDAITDILMVTEPKTMIISSSMDGVIKLWK